MLKFPYHLCITYRELTKFKNEIFMQKTLVSPENPAKAGVYLIKGVRHGRRKDEAAYKAKFMARCVNRMDSRNVETPFIVRY